MGRPVLPREFDSWEEARDYYAMEALVMMQRADRNPTPRNETRAQEAAERAIYANSRCVEPFPPLPDDADVGQDQGSPSQ